MPEIKNQFTGGKMNKDVDERLVPNGEYRDAMNIQVSTSEGSSVGTVQSILGNSAVVSSLGILANSKCVGSIADEKNDALYWFVREPPASFNTTIAQSRDIIFELKGGNVEYVFIDKKQSSISVASLQTPGSGNIVINSQSGFNAINVGDTFQLWQLGVNISGNEFYTVLSKDYSGNLHINIGDYTNASWANAQAGGPGELQIVISGVDGVLKFPENGLITGINIIDDMLFWTDGFTEPKKINIPRSMAGTPSGNLHTRLVNPVQNISWNDGILIQEEHITVIRKAPKNALTTKTEVDPISAFGTTLTIHTFLIDSSNPSQGNLASNSSFELFVLLDPLSPNPLSVNDILLFNPSSSSSLPSDEHQVSAILTNQTNDGSTDLMFGSAVIAAAGTYEIWDGSIIAIGQVSFAPQEYNWAVQIDEDQKFKNKFPRFSYRYKYEDGEYSSFAPFTNIVFEPENFKYDVKEAFNLGMENAATKITLSNYNSNTPSDVVSIDLLYKESNSPVIYTVDTIDSVSGLTLPTHSYEVKTNQIKAVLPENQLLRAWDAVPITSLAQEVTGNRIVYGNYSQNYDLQETPRLVVDLVDREDCGTNHPYKSLKSIRNYSLGVSYLDKYGRQTPVFTNKQADVEIPIDKSNNVNQVSSRILGSTPDWAKYYKVFVKETSSEYYNLAMDRIYDARDGNIWLSFPSSDRNKVDEETFLILKKGVEGAQPVDEKNRYKIIAIENEAPEFIKTRLHPLGKVQENNSLVNPPFNPASNAVVFTGNGSGYPIATYNKVIFAKAEWESVGLPLEDFKDFSVRFSIDIGAVTQSTQIYEVISIETDTGNPSDPYTIVLNKPIEEDFLADTTNPNVPSGAIGMEIYNRETTNSPQFDGRFFVKVKRDINIDYYIVAQATSQLVIAYQGTTQIPFYYMSDGSDGGINTTDDIANIGSGPLNTWEEWNNLYASTGGSPWFIDACYFDGQFPPSAHSYLNSEGIWSGIGTSSNSVPASRSPGNNKGIWTDSSGQTFIDLTFGNVRSSVGNAGPFQTSSYQLHTSADVGDTQNEEANKCSSWESVSGTCGTYQKAAYFEGLSDYNSTNNQLKHWRLGSTSNNPVHAGEQDRISKLHQGSKFKFVGDPNNTIYVISGPVEISYQLSHYNTGNMDDGHGYLGLSSGGCCSYNATCSSAYETWCYGSSGSEQWAATEKLFDFMELLGHSRNRRIRYRIPISDLDGNNISPISSTSTFNPIDTGQPGTADAVNLGNIQFVEEQWVNYVDEQVVLENPAIWETEPKQDIDLDIYYEVDGTFPLEINNETNYTFAPVGSTVSIQQPSSAVPMLQPGTTTVVGWSGSVVQLSAYANNVDLTQSMAIVFSRPDGSCVEAELVNLGSPIVDVSGNDTSFFLNIKPDVSNKTVKHSWFNCYSFRNGVESDRIRDDYNQLRIDKGAKASSTLDEPYKKEQRKHGLIYSGIYNSNSGVNNLNQFIAAEKITKDVNPAYGSIQKLHSRSTAAGDLIALCEDRILKILANKDAVYNADGNPQLTANENVLGQAIPYSGEYGISKNPESFASEAYRVYFTDKVRGTVMRLSMDGLTPISSHGMKDWFIDNLKLSNKLIGSYDDKKDEYNITLEGDASVLVREKPGYPITATFREDVKGWVSFKSFTPENAISCANQYYTFKNGSIWKHHDKNTDANDFYLIPNDSSLTVIINEVPGSIKSFTSINYEGSQSRVKQFITDATTGLTDGEYYNLTPKDGWYVDSIFTDKESGTIDEFIEKEGKWFNYIKGIDVKVDGGTVSINPDGSSSFDQASFAIQGLGILNQTPIQTSVLGCTDTLAANYDAAATIDDGSCIPILFGCMEPTASNYYVMANNSDDSCLWIGCYGDPCDVINSFLLNPDYAQAYNWSVQHPTATPFLDDGSCIYAVYGCTEPLGTNNYNSLANVNQVSCTDNTDPCIYAMTGCMLTTADNYDATANVDNGTCSWSGCTELLATNYLGFPTEASSYVSTNNALYGIQDDGSCLGGGCMDSLANNYDAFATYDPFAGNGSCLYCELTTANPLNNYDGIPVVSTDIADETLVGANNGQIAVVINANAPYLPFTYVLTDSLGSSAFTQTSGVWLNGLPNALSTMFSNLPTGAYSLTIYGSGAGSVCSETLAPIVVGTTVAPIYYGCTDSTACNYLYPADATHVDDNSCEFSTCAGCADPLANYPNSSWGSGAGTSYQSQSGNPFTDTAQCITPGSSAFGPCTIPCGDGNDATSYSNYCCGYTIPGCTDPTACNYTAAPNGQTIVDGSVTCNYNGCTDSTANNFSACATIDDGSCTYTVISGCTNPLACNTTAGATVDDGSCILGFDGVTIGDPDFAADHNLALPFYFFDNGTPFPQLGDTIQNMVIGGYPQNSANDVDVALSIKSLDPTMAQYGPGDSVKFQLREASSGAPPTNFSSVVDGPNTISNTGGVVWNHQAGGAVYGDRTNNPTLYVDPYPWGPSANSSSNYTFDYKHTVQSGFTYIKKYVVEVWSEIGGVEYGRRTAYGTSGPNDSCGVYKEFFFHGYDECSSPYANSGCTNPSACNYDYAATCDDGSCIICTVPCYDCICATPQNGGGCTMQLTVGGCCAGPGTCQYPNDPVGGYSDPNSPCFGANAII